MAASLWSLCILMDACQPGRKKYSAPPCYTATFLPDVVILTPPVKKSFFFSFVSVLLFSASVLPSIWSESWAWKSTPRLTPTPSYSPAHRFASQRLQTPWCLSSMHPCLAHYPWVLFNTNTVNLLCLWSLSCQVTSLCCVPRCWTNGVSRQRWWRDWLSTVP